MFVWSSKNPCSKRFFPTKSSGEYPVYFLTALFAATIFPAALTMTAGAGKRSIIALGAFLFSLFLFFSRVHNHLKIFDLLFSFVTCSHQLDILFESQVWNKPLRAFPFVRTVNFQVQFFHNQ